MSRRRFSLSLKGWLLLSLLPTSALLILGYAVHIYVDLRSLILQGFDQKLIAVGTTTAAFIQPSDHEKLVQPLPLRGLADDPGSGLIWGFDTSERALVSIDPTNGRAQVTARPLPVGFSDLTPGLEPGEVLATDVETGRVLRVALADGTSGDPRQLTPPIAALATDRVNRQLYQGGRSLQRIDLRTGQTVSLSELPEPLRDLTFDHRRGQLWGLNDRGDELLQFDPQTGGLLRRLPLVAEKSEDHPAHWGALPAQLVALAYDPAHDVLLGTGASLFRIDLATGQLSSEGFVPAFGREDGDLYRHYVLPMRRIAQRAELTFLYTQLLKGRDRIVYGLDSTEGEDHSPLLSEDLLPEREISAVQRLLTEGRIHTTEVREWERWGLIKSAFVPIFDAQDRPIAMTGADVDITIIRYQTRRALVITFTFGAVLLVLGGLLALVIARRLNGPLATIKSAALRAAAGDYTQRAVVSRPQELGELALHFSGATEALGHRVRNLQGAISERRGDRDRLALQRRLEELTRAQRVSSPGAPWAWGPADLASPDAGTLGGGVARPDGALVWIRHQALPVSLSGQARHVELTLTAIALLDHVDSDPGKRAAALSGLFSDEIALWAWLTPTTLQRWPSSSGNLYRITRAGRLFPVDTLAGAPVTPAPGEALLLTSVAPPASLTLPLSEEATAASVLAAWRQTAPSSAFALVLLPSS